jgi:hypothetical protein
MPARSRYRRTVISVTVIPLSQSSQRPTLGIKAAGLSRLFVGKSLLP